MNTPVFDETASHHPMAQDEQVIRQQWQERAREHATMDPSWYPHVLAVLARDYPQILVDAVGKAVTENAQRLTRKPVPDDND